MAACRWKSLEAWKEHEKTEWAVETREKLFRLVSGKPILKVERKFAGFTGR